MDFEPTWRAERRGYIRCRTLGHAWHDYTSIWKPQFGLPLTVRCERCGMERRDTLGNDGELLRRHYISPRKYALSKDDERPTRSDFRLMLLALRVSDSRRKRSQVS